MKTAAILAVAAAMAMPLTFSAASAAEPIAGKWKRSNGTLIQYAGSGSRYCAKVLNGKYKGQSIGCMTGKGKNYKGQVKVLDEGKTYSGKATVNGNTMKLAGCVLGGLICKSENLSRQ